ncbi:hypothetical protein C2W62_47090 [Candidatus Entotheonella serta]|nr:hypothetical protein C2W62_47090 [Candidatus Entotheonella serta]
MKKIIAIAAFVAISLVSVSAMAQQPVGPRNITVTNTPDGGYHVTRFGDELMPGWLVLIYNPDTRRHDVAVVSEGDCGDCMFLALLNDGSVVDIVDTDRYLVVAADSTVRVVQP